MCEHPNHAGTHRSTRNPSLPIVLDLSNPHDVRAASQITASGSSRPIYWVSSQPPEQLTGRLSTTDFQGAWLAADGTHALCRIAPGLPTARVRVPSEIKPSDIPAFLTRLILVRLGWDIPRPSSHTASPEGRRTRALPRVATPHPRPRRHTPVRETAAR